MWVFPLTILENNGYTAVRDIRTSTDFANSNRHIWRSAFLHSREHMVKWIPYVPAATQLLFEILPNLGVHL